jgi:predicted transcriptional regulator
MLRNKRNTTVSAKCRRDADSDGAAKKDIDPHLAARIVRSYVRHHGGAAGELSSLIATAYSAHRSALAKHIGLGRKPRQVEASLPSSGKVPKPAATQPGHKWWSAAT